jgi:Flp pilus assembly protein TadD
LGKAIDHYQKALRYRPDYVNAFINLGNIYRDTGDETKAAYLYQEALKVDSNAVDALNNLGILFAQKGDIRKAFGLFERAVRLSPDDREIRKNYDRAKSHVTKQDLYGPLR